MTKWIVWTRGAVGVLLLFGLVAGVSRGQRAGQGQPLPSVVQPAQQQESRTPGEGPSPDLLQRQARQRNDERQRRLVADTDKLLELATQLHTDVGKTDRNVLSLDVIRRAEEIEKLAHAVKERMKG